MDLKKLPLSLAVAGFVAAGAVLPAQAAVTTLFSAGPGCDGGSTVEFASGGPSVKVSLCVTTTSEGVCGATIQLQSANAGDNGRFHIVNRTLGRSFPEANAAGELAFPVAVNHAGERRDFGGIVPAAAPVPAGAGRLLATFELAPQALATEPSYQIGASSISEVAVTTGGDCTNAKGAPINATFTMKRVM